MALKIRAMCKGALTKGEGARPSPLFFRKSLAEFAACGRQINGFPRRFAPRNDRNVFFDSPLVQFTRNYTQTVKRAADNKRRYAPGEGSIPPVLLSRVSKGVPPLAHDFACKV